mmetsp:Transcript_89235/g.277444  ORF Transcript_89235/g.277444 Transcript_89235/m.277444 type:complete len:179 (-) Transcript_89235:75-611(-)
MRVGRAPRDFTEHAERQVRKYCQGLPRPAEGGAGAFEAARVFSYAEYCVVDAAGGGRRIEGRLLHECGWRPSAGGPRPPRLAAPWLRAFRLPLGGHVDRELCAEFQLLQELCGILAPEGRPPEHQPEVVGSVSLFTTISPCMSCIGAIRQFQLLFPEVAIEMGEFDSEGAKPAPLGGW